jgi:hypothetical protein
MLKLPPSGKVSRCKCQGLFSTLRKQEKALSTEEHSQAKSIIHCEARKMILLLA